MRLSAIVMCLTGLLFCMACNGKMIEETFGPQPESPLPRGFQFEDVPAPLKFQLVETVSYIRYSGGARHGFLVYEGTSAPRHVTDFYVRTLPDLGWISLGERGEKPGTLVFERERERCSISVKSVGAITRVEIKIEPRIGER